MNKMTKDNCRIGYPKRQAWILTVFQKCINLCDSRFLDGLKNWWIKRMLKGCWEHSHYILSSTNPPTRWLICTCTEGPILVVRSVAMKTCPTATEICPGKIDTLWRHTALMWPHLTLIYVWLPWKQININIMTLCWTLWRHTVLKWHRNERINTKTNEYTRKSVTQCWMCFFSMKFAKLCKIHDCK